MYSFFPHNDFIVTHIYNILCTMNPSKILKMQTIYRKLVIKLRSLFSFVVFLGKH